MSKITILAKKSHFCMLFPRCLSRFLVKIGRQLKTIKFAGCVCNVQSPIITELNNINHRFNNANSFLPLENIILNK